MRATMKMVKRAATDDSTGEVKLIRTRKEPEKASRNVSVIEHEGKRAGITHLHWPAH